MTKFQMQMFYATLTSFMVFTGIMMIPPDNWIGAGCSFTVSLIVFISWTGFYHHLSIGSSIKSTK